MHAVIAILPTVIITLVFTFIFNTHRNTCTHKHPLPPHTQSHIDEFTVLCENEMRSTKTRKRGKLKFVELDKDKNGLLEKDK